MLLRPTDMHPTLINNLWHSLGRSIHVSDNHFKLNQKEPGYGECSKYRETAYGFDSPNYHACSYSVPTKSFGANLVKY